MSNFMKDHVAPQNYLRVAARPDEPESDVGFGDALGASIDLTSPIRAIEGLVDESRIAADPAYQLDFEAEMEGVPEYARPILAETLESSKSLEHTKYLKQRMLNELKSAEEMGAYTGDSTAGAIGMTIMAAALDPINLAASVGSAAAGVRLTQGLAAQRLGRVKRAATIAGIEGAVNAALEVPLYMANPTSTSEDILWAAAFGTALGGTIGAAAKIKPQTLGKRVLDQDTVNAERTMDRMAEVEAHEIAGVTPPKQEIPVDFLRATMKDPMVRKAPAPARPEVSAARTKAIADLEAKKAELEELNTRTLPDEPVAPKLGDEVAAIKGELDFVKRVRAGAEGLNKIQATKAQIEWGRAKSAFLESYRKVDPEGYQATFRNLDRLNPPIEELEAALPAIEKRVAQMQSRYEKDLDGYAAAVDALGTQKDELLDAIDELDAQIKATPEVDPTIKSMGAAEAERGGIELSKLNEEELDALYEGPKARQTLADFGAKGNVPVRYDLAGQLDRSPNAMVSDLSRRLFQDAVPKLDHAVNPESASEIAEQLRDAVMTMYNSEANPAFANWAKERGYYSGAAAWFRDPHGNARALFEEEVREAVKAGAHPDENVMQAARTFSKLTERVHEFGEQNLPGWKEFPYDPTYVPRQWNKEKLMHLNSEYVADPASFSPGVDSILGELVYRGFMEQNPTFDPARTARIANNVAQRFIERSSSVDFEYPDFGKLTREKLEEMFDAVDITKVDREQFFAGLETQYAQPDAGRVSHAKQRMDIKTDHTPLVARREDGTEQALTLEDVFTHRADALLHGYVNQVAGWGSLSKVTGGKIHNDSSLKRYIEGVKKFEQTYVEFDKAKGFKRIDSEIDKLMIGVNHTLGRALEDPNTQIAKTRRVLNGWNFMRVMNQAIFPQYSESSKIINATSLQTVSHYAPSVANAFKLMRAGAELPDDVRLLVLAAREYGIGGSYTRGATHVNRYQSDLDGTMFNKYDKERMLIEHLKRPTAGMLQFALDQQEVLTFMSMTSEWGQRAKGLKEFTKGDYARFAWMGLDRKMVGRINKQLMKHAKGEDGKPWAESKSKYIADLNLAEWTDYVARDKYGFGMKRRISETIQTNNPGNLPAWSQKNLGAIVAQFRSFPLAAHHKQLLHGLGFGDMQAYMTFMANSMFASLARAGQVYLNSLGREDAQEYRDRYMSPDMLALAAVERSAWAGLPSLLQMPNTAYRVITGKHPGSMRSTGLQRGISGIPGVDVMDKAINMKGSLEDLLVNGNVQRVFKETWALMPYSNMPGLKNAAAALADQLPE